MSDFIRPPPPSSVDDRQLELSEKVGQAWKSGKTTTGLACIRKAGSKFPRRLSSSNDIDQPTPRIRTIDTGSPPGRVALSIYRRPCLRFDARLHVKSTVRSNSRSSVRGKRRRFDVYRQRGKNLVGYGLCDWNSTVKSMWHVVQADAPQPALLAHILCARNKVRCECWWGESCLCSCATELRGLMANVPTQASDYQWTRVPPRRKSHSSTQHGLLTTSLARGVMSNQAFNKLGSVTSHPRLVRNFGTCSGKLHRACCLYEGL